MSEYKTLKPRDPVYRDLVSQLYQLLYVKQGSREEIHNMREKCIDRFAKFNHLERTEKTYSLNSLSTERENCTQDERRTHAHRTCFNRDGKPFAVVLHVIKKEFKQNDFFAIAYKKGLAVSFISSFQLPGKHLDVVFRRKVQAKNKGILKKKVCGIFKKLLKVLSMSITDII